MEASMSQHASTGKLTFERSSFLDKNDRHRQHVKNHYFNSSCHILLPGCETIPKQVEDILLDHTSYIATAVPISLFLDPEFIAGFIKRGEVFALSQGTCVDTQDCAALLPTGVLVLNVGKDTYQELGLEGRRSKLGKTLDKYVIEIDLRNDKRFAPGKKLFQRLQWCFKERKKMTMDFLLSWKPSDDKVCPSSIQNYFHSSGVVCNRQSNTKSVFNYSKFTTPVISPDQLSSNGGAEDSTESCDYMEVFEWLGACAAGVDICVKDADDFISGYTTPYPNRTVPHCVGSQYKGVVLPSQMQQVIDILRSYIKTKHIPWCSVTCFGFVDSPVSWHQRDHGFHRNGDNLYTLLLFESDDYWLYSAIGKEDICP